MQPYIYIFKRESHFSYKSLLFREASRSSGKPVNVLTFKYVEPTSILESSRVMELRRRAHKRLCLRYGLPSSRSLHLGVPG